MNTYKGARPQSRTLLWSLGIGAVLIVFWGIIKFSQGVEQQLDQTLQASKSLFESETTTPTPSNSAAPSSNPLPSLSKSFSLTGAKSAESQPAGLLNAATANGENKDVKTEGAPGAEKTDKNTENTATVAKIGNQLAMEFALLTKDQLDKIQLGVGRGGSNIFSKSQWENVSKSAGFKIMSNESHALTVGQPTLFSQGVQEPRTKENIGFFIEITPTRLTDTNADYKLVIKRALPEVTPQGDLRVISQVFNETVSLAAGQAFGISGLLPRKTLMENEDALYKNNILRALLEPSFQKYEDEFVIMLAP
jgi:hypothetical protein